MMKIELDNMNLLIIYYLFIFYINYNLLFINFKINHHIIINLGNYYIYSLI